MGEGLGCLLRLLTTILYFLHLSIFSFHYRLTYNYIHRVLNDLAIYQLSKPPPLSRTQSSRQLSNYSPEMKAGQVIKTEL